MVMENILHAIFDSLFGLEKKRLRGDPIDGQKCWKSGSQEDGAGLFLLVLSNGMRGNGQKQTKEIPPKLKKTFITVRVTAQGTVLRGVMETPSVEKFKSQLDINLINGLWETLFEWEFGLEEPKWSLPVLPIW